MNDYDIAEIYKDMELHLIRSMRRNLGRHLKEEEAEGFKWKAWQAEKLKELKRYQRQNKDIINSYTRGLPDDISKILKDEFKQGNKHEINRYNKLFDKDVSDSFFKMDDRKVNALIKVVNNDLSKGNHACLRMINDTYRKTIHRAAMFATTGTMTTKQAVDMATKDFLNRGLDVIEYKDGRRVNIASYSQMAVRTASQRAMLMGEAEFRKELGEYLVIISRHGTACELCKPHETKVYVDDVYANGKPDGKHRLLSEAMEEGLFHPNCRHGVNTYYDLEGIDEAAPTDDVPIDNDDPEVSRIDVAMRKEQRKVEGCLDKGNRDKARAKLKELEAEKEKVVFNNVTDNIKGIDEKLHTETIDRINELSNKYKSMPDFFKTRGSMIESADLGKTAEAATTHNFNMSKVYFKLNRSKYSDYNDMVERISEQIATNWTMPCDEKFYSVYTITHEYGHAVQCYLIDQYNLTHPKEFNEVVEKVDGYLSSVTNNSNIANINRNIKKVRNKYLDKIANDIGKEILDIARKNNPNFVLSNNLSIYGKTSVYEFFAEAFANANCGKPNELGKAMLEYLKMKGV